jgi:hypothetical protein
MIMVSHYTVTHTHLEAALSLKDCHVVAFAKRVAFGAVAIIAQVQLIVRAHSRSLRPNNLHKTNSINHTI